MSATLIDTVRSLHDTAARRLQHLIETETDPHLLARLIATALRFKVPLPKEQSAAAEVARPNESRPPQAAPPVPVAPSSPPAPAPVAATDEDDDDWEPFIPSGLKALTEQEIADLTRQLGPVQAEFRRRERLQMLKEEAQFLEEDRQRAMALAKKRTSAA